GGVVDEAGFAQRRRQALRKRPGDDLDVTAGRERNDDRDLPRRIRLGRALINYEADKTKRYKGAQRPQSDPHDSPRARTISPGRSQALKQSTRRYHALAPGCIRPATHPLVRTDRRFGSFSSDRHAPERARDVRFAPKADKRTLASPCPLSAISRHSAVQRKAYYSINSSAR